MKIWMDLRSINEKELQAELAKALRTKNKTQTISCVYEYRRRQIFIPQKMYGWMLGVFPDIAQRNFQPSWYEFSDRVKEAAE